MDFIELPQELATAIGQESRDFAVLAGRPQPLKKTVGQILGGILWLGFSFLFIYLILSSREPALGAPDADGTVISISSGTRNFPLIIMGVFVIVGVAILASGILSLFRNGGYFVGTAQRLIHFRSGKLRSIDWEQFSGDIEVTGSAEKGNISLQLRTGRMVSRGKGQGERYVPDYIYISDVTDPFGIERLCRKRIKENDPTPAGTSFM